MERRWVIQRLQINNLKDDQLVNNLFVESENRNLRSAMRNSRNVEYIFIIDEFHLNYNTKSYRKIVEFFNPHVIIGMSATPSKEQLGDADAKYNIPVSEVMTAGMIKTGICFNTASDYTDREISKYNTIDEFFLRMAIRQRDLLEEKYKAVGSSVIPLLLIQFNDDKENTDIIHIKELLDADYENNIHGIYAIWISETDNKKIRLRSEDRIIETLSSNTVRILLFKQAVATGWDCPRAQVLLRYRKVVTRDDTNEVCPFDIQTLGRILRMPEPQKFDGMDYKHYSDDTLNYGYVYVPNNSYILEKNFSEAYADDTNLFQPKMVSVDFSNNAESNVFVSREHQEPTEEQIASSVPKNDIDILNTVSDNIEKRPVDMSNSTMQLMTASHHLSENVASAKASQVVTTVTKSPQQVYADQYGSAIIKVETLLSRVNLEAKNVKPDDEAINKLIKKTLKDTTFQMDLRECDLHADSMTFLGKAMGIDDTILESRANTTFHDTGISFSIDDTPSVLEDKANKLLSEMIDRKGYSKEVKEYIKKQIKLFFRQQIGFHNEDDHNNFSENKATQTNKRILLYKSIIKEIVRNIDDSIRNLSTYQFEPSSFQFPRIFPSYQPEANSHNKALMHIPLPETASGPERTFEKHLDELSDVLIWYKNKDHGKNAFCVKYEKRIQNRGAVTTISMPTYPDFIVIFNNGGIGIYEIKDYDKYDENDQLKNVAITRLVSKMKSMDCPGVFGGVVYIDQHSGTIRDSEQYPELR